MSKIKIFSLGGLNENGKNMYVVEVDKNIYVFDAGLKYDNEKNLGIDYIIPNIDYLVKNQKRIKGIFLSHGHDSNIGAVPDILKNIPNVNIYGAKLTLELLKQDLTEVQLKKSHLIEVRPHRKIEFGKESIFPIAMTHSIPDALCYVLYTKDGAICYTGDFIMEGMMGTANFGKVFKWTARPTALKVTYKSKVGIVDKVGTYDKEGAEYKGKQDNSRIFAAVVDWSKQHGVTSGIGEPSGMWDPVKKTELEEGAILGYASLMIDESSDGFVTVEIPFMWYDTVSAPADGNYSIVISCATSNRGDYLTGCSTNELRIDSMEFVY